MAGAIVDGERGRPAPHIDPEFLPRERLLEDALAKVAREEQGVGCRRRDRCQKPQLGHAEILRLVHHDMRERLGLPVSKVGGGLPVNLWPGGEAPLRERCRRDLC